MRWLGVARRAFDMLCERSLYRDAFGSTLAEQQTVQNWIADSAAEMQAARLMTLHAAWMMDTAGRGGGAQGDLADQVLRRQGAARRDRPRDPGPRLAGLLDRPAARGDVPLRARRPHLRRPGRGAPRVGGAPDAARLRGPRRRCADRAHPDAARGRPGGSSPRSSTRSPRTTDPPGPLRLGPCRSESWSSR